MTNFTHAFLSFAEVAVLLVGEPMTALEPLVALEARRVPEVAAVPLAGLAALPSPVP